MEFFINIVWEGISYKVTTRPSANIRLKQSELDFLVSQLSLNHKLGRPVYIKVRREGLIFSRSHLTVTRREYENRIIENKVLVPVKEDYIRPSVNNLFYGIEVNE